VNSVLIIAAMAFTETVRDKILYSILVFALAMIGSSTILVTLSVGGEGRIVKNLGLACITLFGLFIAVFIGINLVSREIERRTIFSLLSKPVRRASWRRASWFSPGRSRTTGRPGFYWPRASPLWSSSS
jgi:ABC-type transport system involved in multi-copper enzyme maturation permease subunit